MASDIKLFTVIHYSKSIKVKDTNSNPFDLQRQYVNIISPDVPMKFAGRSQIDTGSNQCINFDATSAKKDLRSVKH